MDIFTFFSSHPDFFITVIALLGAMIGSFLNVVIYRIPVILKQQWGSECQHFLQEQGATVENVKSIDNTCSASTLKQRLFFNPCFNIAYPGSHCPQCQHKITLWENIPILSWLFLKGQCSQCHTSIPLRYPFVELLTALLSAIIAWKFGVTWLTLAGLIFTWILISLSFIDMDHKYLPDVMVYPLLWLGLFLSLFHSFTSPQEAIIGALAGYLSLWSVYWLFKLIRGKEGMGYGDFKLLAALGTWMGWQALPQIILFSALTGAIIGVTLIVLKKNNADTQIPFGPYLALAGWLAFILDNKISLFLVLSSSVIESIT